MRALPLEFPEDRNAHGQDLEFMLGPWLLVAPVVDKSGEREVYLPVWGQVEGAGERRRRNKGGTECSGPEWIDFWTGRHHPAGRTLMTKSPLTRIPIFVRAGAILPMMPDAERIPARAVERLAIQVYRGFPSRFTLFEDEGLTTFALARAGNRFTLTSSGWRPKRNLKLIWR